MATIDFSQAELKIIRNLLSQLSYNIPDSKLITPIFDKIESNIDPETEVAPASELTKTN